MRLDKLSDEKMGLLDNIRDMESDYKIVKEDLRVMEEKNRELS